MTPSPDEVLAARSVSGGWSRAQLAEWGVPWPPPRGWRQQLADRWKSMANDEMVEGYLDGLKDSRLELSASNRSQSYQHGWLNGRDDRIGQPRASAAELRQRADAAMAADHISDTGV